MRKRLLSDCIVENATLHVYLFHNHVNLPQEPFCKESNQQCLNTGPLFITNFLYASVTTNKTHPFMSRYLSLY